MGILRQEKRAEQDNGDAVEHVLIKWSNWRANPNDPYLTKLDRTIKLSRTGVATGISIFAKLISSAEFEILWDFDIRISDLYSQCAYEHS